MRNAFFLAVLLNIGSLALGADPVREAPKVVKPADHGVGKWIPDLAFRTTTEQASKLSTYQGKKTLVIAFTSTSCPLSKKYAATLAKLEEAYARKDVAFLFVNPMATDRLETIREAIQTHKLQGAYVHDHDGTFAKSIGASVTTDVFVLDATRTVVYRGAIDDQYGLGYSLDAPKNAYLRMALDAHLAGKAPLIAATQAPGCALDLDKAKVVKADVTYHNTIERIVQANCVECHRKDGVAPFALDTAKDIIAHAGMIKKVVEKGTMPPWFAAPPEKGQATVWGNDRSLTPTDKNALLTWLASERPIGVATDAPKPKSYESGWLIGKPDAIYKPAKPVKVAATGTMPYQNVYAEQEVPEDRWVQTLEVRPSARQVVHHVLVFVMPPRKLGERAGLLDAIASDERQGYYAIYVPGNSTLVYPDGFGKKLPKGSRIRFQIHYTPNGTATEDTTELGLIFAKEPPQHEVRVAGIVNTWFSIPPGADNHSVVSILPVPWDVKIIGFLPHMHLRGKAYKYEVSLPGNKSEVLLDVPNYDFNWQLQYKFAEPKFIPKGSILKGTAHFDNSDKNPANPDPKKTVRWGPQTFDEMMLGYVEYYIINEKK